MAGIWYNFSAKIGIDTKEEITKAFNDPEVVKHFNEFLMAIGLQSARVVDIGICDSSIKSKK